MDRIQRGQPATVQASWERAGVPVDPGDPVTVTVTRDSNGTQGPPITATGGPGTSRQIALTPSDTANLDWLTLLWTAADGSTLTTYIEIVGDFYFTVARARQMSPLQDTATYSTQSIINFRTLAEFALESICGVAFVPSYRREEMSIEGYGLIRGSRRRITKVLQITTFMSTPSGGNQVPLTTLSGLQIVNGADIYFTMLWNWFSRPIMCAYEHGYPFVPPRVSNAALLLARRWLVESPWDERTTGFRTRDGGEMSILTANHSDPFDLPEIVATVDSYAVPLVA
jgi:hypothetical protein